MQRSRRGTRTRAELLEKMSNAAFDLIKIIELERSGIRDGDGHWSGTDVMGHTTRELVSIIAAYDAFVDHEYEAQLKKHGITADDFPL